MRKRLLLLLVSATLLCGCSGKSRELDVPPARNDLAQPEALAWWSRAAIDAYMRYSAWRGSQSGYIAMFARDGVPVYSAVAGWKDISTGEPMAMDTPVRIASMTKPVTAVAAMLLVEEGKLSLDDPVAKYIPEFAKMRVATSDTPAADGTFPSAPASTVLRVRHLLMFASVSAPGSTKRRRWRNIGMSMACTASRRARWVIAWLHWRNCRCSRNPVHVGATVPRRMCWRGLSKWRAGSPSASLCGHAYSSRWA
ncbi:MAG: beta-lactamase family protein [Haliea sp.]|nr:beta-lactamase family protein [Haliea sp.]